MINTSRRVVDFVTCVHVVIAAKKVTLRPCKFGFVPSVRGLVVFMAAVQFCLNVVLTVSFFDQLQILQFLKNCILCTGQR